MPSSTIQVGTVLMKEWPGMPELLGFETEPCFGEWSWVNVLDEVALDCKIRVAVMATEVKVMFWGFLGAVKIQCALKRILAKVKQQHFNGLEVTAVVARHFLGIPYVIVSAHSRHKQH